MNKRFFDKKYLRNNYEISKQNIMNLKSLGIKEVKEKNLKNLKKYIQ